MTFDDDLRQAFRDFAASAPDAASVHGRLHRALDRRRRRHQIAAVAGVSLAVTGLTVGLRVVEDGARQHAASVPPASTPTAGARTPRPTPSPIGGAPQNAVTKFFGAHYGYDDAVTLAQLWRQTDPYLCKAVAGQVLLDGGTLPIDPGGTAAPTDPSPIRLDTTAFTAAGYLPEDARQLGALWNEADVDVVTAVAGQQLRDGKTLPFPPR